MVKRTRRKAAVYQRKGERDMEDWLKSFYTQTDPVKRQQLLLENTREMENIMEIRFQVKPMVMERFALENL